MRDSLIKLGYQHPELRPYLTKVLDELPRTASSQDLFNEAYNKTREVLQSINLMYTQMLKDASVKLAAQGLELNLSGGSTSNTSWLLYGFKYGFAVGGELRMKDMADYPRNTTEINAAIIQSGVHTNPHAKLNQKTGEWVIEIGEPENV